MRFIRTLIAPATATALALCGCTVPAKETQIVAVSLPRASSSSLGGAPPVMIATYRPRDVTASARLVGRLAIIDGCVMLESDSDPHGVLVFFPERQASWDSAVGLLTIGIDTFRIGDTVAITGGPSLFSNFADRARMPASCVRTRGFFAGASATRVE